MCFKLEGARDIRRHLRPPHFSHTIHLLLYFSPFRLFHQVFSHTYDAVIHSLTTNLRKKSHKKHHLYHHTCLFLSARLPNPAAFASLLLYPQTRMLPQHHNAKRNYPLLDPTPHGTNASRTASFQPPLNGGEGLAGSDILKLHRKHSRQWTDRFRKVIGVKGRNEHGTSVLYFCRLGDYTVLIVNRLTRLCCSRLVSKRRTSILEQGKESGRRCLRQRCRGVTESKSIPNDKGIYEKATTE